MSTSATAPASSPPGATPSTGTATTAGAREHARAQEAAARERWRRPGAPAGVDGSAVVWSEVVAGGGYTHRRLAAGTAVQLTDVEGDACAHVLLYNAAEPWERLNVADTVKVQWQVYSGAGQLLLSDQGRVLASLLTDTSGHHDAVFGASTAARNTARYGDGALDGPTPAGRELLVLGAGKHGLGRRDVPPSVSFFQGVRIDEGGRPRWRGSAGAGTSLVLRTEMAVVLLVANTPHPLDPRPDYTSTPLEVVAWRERTTAPDDPLWSATPEGRRAFENTTSYRRGAGL